MLFPTLSFGIFFLIVFAIAWELQHLAANAQGLPGRGQLRLLWVLGLAFHGAARDELAHQLCRGTPARHHRQRQGASPARRRRHRAQSRHSRLLQILRLLHGVVVATCLPASGSSATCRSWRSSCRSASPSSPSTASPMWSTSIAARSRRRNRRSTLFLYISFFPQLVAGPIVRASDFLPQLKTEPELDRVHGGERHHADPARACSRRW